MMGSNNINKVPCFMINDVVCRKLSAADASRTSTQGCMQSSADIGHSTANTANIRDGLVLVCNGLL